ncbi:elongator complex protein 4 [Lingula anatina]|uniref:Elongator complex protein 4 n=1 Tax=Lingula anatina TaxID=7574 RepID=A0A1S3HW70_LINAN|nr:elongator complex protein 4 [Lingula anatina]|eukprot:XP_013389796.1 elongator complex protein 4 [Lingula anatina]
MAAPTTSFRKKVSTKILQIPGTRPSLHNNQLLISSGVPSFDSVIGGGIAVGTAILVEEDTYGSYGKLLLKYFIAEGIVCGHSSFLATADTKPDQIVKELPSAIVDDPGAVQDAQPSSSEADDSMKIAWRYQNMSKVQAAPVSTKFGHYFDLTKVMNPEVLAKTDMRQFYLPDEEIPDRHSNSIMNPAYQKLLQDIKSHIINKNFSTSSSKQPQQQRNILRIAIHSLGSPLWGEGEVNPDSYDPSLPRFLYGLRALLRSAFASCLITVPTYIFNDTAFTRRIENMCDTVVQLESFVGSERETNPVYKDYHGLFHILKIPRLNSLTCHMPDSLDLAFKLRRKKFTIEKLHLPPELSDTASRPQEDKDVVVKPKTVGCSTGSSKLDF